VHDSSNQRGNTQNTGTYAVGSAQRSSVTCIDNKHLPAAATLLAAGVTDWQCWAYLKQRQDRMLNVL
jgi:hypothetical protein